MTQYFSKISKLVLWVLVPTIFISGTKLDEEAVFATWVEEGYSIEISGDLNNNLNGIVDFETAIEKTSKGISFSTLILKLDNKDSVFPHSIEFLISLENTTDIIPVGTFKVSRDHDGFLNNFEGVFGFANINVLGELPLFAQSGEIRIDHLDDTSLKGTLSIHMGNTMGKSVQINGSFIATK